MATGGAEDGEEGKEKSGRESFGLIFDCFVLGCCWKDRCGIRSELILGVSYAGNARIEVCFG